MNQQDWLTCTDPERMLEILRGKKSHRKQRLFACACCRLIWGETPGPYQKAVEVSEAYADGEVDKDALKTARDRATRQDVMLESAQAVCRACDVTYPSQVAAGAAYWASQRGMARHIQEKEAALIRDIFHPFRPKTRAGRSRENWMHGTCQQLAQSIYTDRAFDRLPILADALEEA